MTKPMLDVLTGKKPSRRPVWLMRQAGRYLEEYRAVRARAGSFLELCYNPQLACEVTLQPLRRYDLDAAILFADILLVPQAMGCDLKFEEGEGPVLRRIAGSSDVADLRGDGERAHDVLSPVYETVSLLSSRVPDGVTLIGFCGAPWTVATYMIQGGTSAERLTARMAALRQEPWLDDLIEKICEVSVTYLSRQIAAGAEVVQIFDTWAVDLPDGLMERYCFTPIRRIVHEVRRLHPGVPVIGFARGVGTWQSLFQSSTGVSAVGLESGISLDWVAANLVPNGPVQGNLDPVALQCGGQAMEASCRLILEKLPRDRHIFNLGHGIRKETPASHVGDLVAVIRSHDD